MYGLTIRQIFRELVVLKRQAEDRFDRDMRLAWHIEVLQRQKTLPPIKKLLIATQAEANRPQTEDEKRAAIDEFRGRHGLTAKRVRLVRRPVVH